MDEVMTKHPITGIQWNYVFMSSLLRSFEPKPCPCFRVLQELGNQELYNDFCSVAANLFRASKSPFPVTNLSLLDELRFGDLLDKAKQGSNLMVQKITEYLCKKRRINDILGILIPCKIELILVILLVQQEDPLITTHISDALLSVDKCKETILLLAERIKAYPYLIPLLLKQAQAFIKSEFYEYAMKLSKICVDLCPESFEAWF
jgi:hypothetical protein